MHNTLERILILDFGSQYTQLIARRLRELHVYSEIIPSSTKATDIAAMNPSGIILSGGPNSTHENLLDFDKQLLKLNTPILGICYGMQLLNVVNKGSVKKNAYRRIWQAGHLPRC
jgi:GMP synthase (glutamine-hydrolysing)